MLWDVLCKVVDNHGDAGFGWRLSADLAARGESVRFWLDDTRALDWMAPERPGGIEVRPWAASATIEPLADVVVETFGCGLPEAYAARLARADPAPPWLDVEYLTAESYAARSHGLPSPRPNGPGAGAARWCFYPGFDDGTGGLLREPDLAERQRRFDRTAWLQTHAGIAPDRLAEVRVVSLFCYENTALPALLEALSEAPTVLLASTGRAARQVTAILGPGLVRGGLRAVVMPRTSQREFDHRLWAADLNLVRGEDSFVRALWAGRPFVWQIYPQDDGAEMPKLEAFLDRFVEGAPAPLAGALRRCFRAWNAAGGTQAAPTAADFRPPERAWREHCQAWRASLCARTDLSSRLIVFARSRMLE